MMRMKMSALCGFVLTTLLVLASARPKAGPEQKCKSGPVDLVFLIDSSRSVRPHEFETMRKFMIDILSTLDIGLNATRVGVVQYSSQVRSEFSLKTHPGLDAMVKGINEIIPLAQGTMTGLAIKYVMNSAFIDEEGDRPKVPNVAVIVTDGRPQDRVAEVAAEARGKGIEIYAVGVARADMASLRAMASPPFEDHVFLVESFDLIHQFGLQFQDKLCGVDLCLESEHSCEHICESSPGSFHCLCLPGYTLREDGKTCAAIDLCAEERHDCEQICVTSPGSFTCDCNKGFKLDEDKKSCTMIDYCSFGNHSCDHECEGVLNGYFCRCHQGYRLLDAKRCEDMDLCSSVQHGCEHQCVSTPGSFYCVCPEGQLLQEDGQSCGSCKSANIDLVLLIDGSKSVRPQNFELVKKFVNQVVDSLDVSAQGTRVGLVQYSSRVRTEFPLNRHHTADEIKAAVMKVDYMEKGTMTGLALKHMLETSFSEAEGARPADRNIPRVGLVFTDGRSQDDITEFAKKAKEAGITMYAVGVGKAVEDELREIASEPLEKHFYYTTDFSAISTIAENLKLNVCPAESQGKIEVKDPCACESLVEFQQATMSSLDKTSPLTMHLLSAMTARLEQLENQLLSRK
uniref:VWFA domain-containing protein n=1 Tax=Gasterosteus aculeatus aculeatus TaxID=481459 RepID=G3N413_GASAC